MYLQILQTLVCDDHMDIGACSTITNITSEQISTADDILTHQHGPVYHQSTQAPEHVGGVDHSYIYQKPRMRDAATQWKDQTLFDHAYNQFDAKVATIGSDLNPLTSTPIKQTLLINSSCDLDNSLSSELNVSIHANQNDESYEPSVNHSDTSDELSDEECSQKSPEEDKKYLVFGNCLEKLFRRCQLCGNLIINSENRTKGSMVTYVTTCSAGCSNTWHSQPMIRAMPLGNLLLAGAILFTGGQYTKYADFAKVLNLEFLCESTFYSLQNTYLFPVIEETFNLQQTAILAAFSGENVYLIGDGQCDSPGHNAKYSTYTVMDDDTDLIVASKVVCLGEECVKYSNGMELVGLDRCLNEVLAHGIMVEGLATDRHPQINCYMRKQRADIEHQFEIFHTAKGVKKELLRLSKTRDTELVNHWIQSISNHMWWSSATCNGDALVSRLVFYLLPIL